ncbi:hypothetical protein KYY02_29800 [Streptomyces pimonensis]|uniref:Uncharacterized protein n=1 Tax=Streptomyces pimonensis TaxID=2860288 RepID=A0ABV4J6Z5_9ACTN
MGANEGEPLRLYGKVPSYTESAPEVFLGTARKAAESVLSDIAVREAEEASIMRTIDPSAFAERENW